MVYMLIQDLIFVSAEDNSFLLPVYVAGSGIRV